ncbi:MAG: thymidine kinase [Maritimibacter sp.]
MAKLYFHYSTMNAGKSTLLLQASYNYRERGMDTYLITAKLDHRAGDGRIGSRIGIGARAVDDLRVPVMAYGLRVDFQGNLFPGSATLLALADEMREARTICHCGKKATMVVRQDEAGNVLVAGDQVQIGGNESYVSLCRKHWREAVGDKA